MSNKQLRRQLRLLASTSVLACAIIAAPVSVRVQLDRPAWHLEAPPPASGAYHHVLGEPLELETANRDSDADADRLNALARLGLAEETSYEPPVLLTLSQAQAASGGGSGGDGGGSGGGAGGSAGGSEGASSGTSGTSGTSGGSFGDVEQVGPSLSEDEEAAAITSGWQ